MTHANTSAQFARIFKSFPCGEPEYCKILNGSQRHPNGKCRTGIAYSRHFVKMGDSGVFTRDGCKFSDYRELFKEYSKLGVRLGVIIDYLKDSERTLESAEEAIEVFRRGSRSFKLVGVAQGNSLAEYLECYAKLRRMGFDRIAVGGLLRKKENSKHYVHVRDEKSMYGVLRAIRRGYPRDWIFALGAYHPKRHNRLDALNVWGGDYKGWIFHYPEPMQPHPRRWLDQERYAAVRQYIESDVVRRISHEAGNHNLLVLGCSKVKLDIPDPLPAIERYDGPGFRMARKLFFDGLHLDVDLMILSGRFGLLRPNTLVPPYNHRIGARRANGKSPTRCEEALVDEVAKGRYREVFLAMGSDYSALVNGPLLRSAGVKVEMPSGPIGKRMAQTRRWLLSKSNKSSPRAATLVP